MLERCQAELREVTVPLRYTPSMWRRAQLAGLLAALGAAACGSSTVDQGDPITIAVLLPFTGHAGAVGNNLEHALMMVADAVNDPANASRGIHGAPVKLLVVDAHAGARDLEARLQTALDARPVAIIGPEDAETAALVLPLAAQQGVHVISPYVGASLDMGDLGDFTWFRLSPTASDLGKSLGSYVHRDGHSDVTVVRTDEAYSSLFAQAAVAQLQSLGATVRRTLVLPSGASSYAGHLEQVPAADLERILLAAQPVPAAHLVNDISALFPSTTRRWFFAPTLKTEFFVQNTATQHVEGGIGVTSNVTNRDQETFAARYLQLWRDGPPTEAAFFYYDALALMLLAYAKAWNDPQEPRPDYYAVRDAIIDVQYPIGVVANWDEVVRGLDLVQRFKVYYSGLTGPIVAGQAGARELGTASFWRVENGVISTLP